MHSASSKLLNLNQDNLSKKSVFLVKCIWNWSYDNFSQRNSRVNRIWVRNYNVITFIWKHLYFKEIRRSQFYWHHQNCNHAYYATFKDRKKVKRIKKYVLKYTLYLYFLIYKLLISAEKCSCQQKSTGVSRNLYPFWIFFR